MPVAQLGDIELYYERSGQGARLLLISGTSGDLRVRAAMFRGPLCEAFDVLAYDQRGLGRSSKPDVPYSMADYADDAAALMDHVGWDSARVIGISFGGMVAQELALRHPRKVERVVLTCTSPGGAGGPSYPLQEFADLTGEARGRRLIPLSDTRRDEAWAKANPELFAEALAQIGTDPYAGEPGRAMGARRQLEARAGHDTWERLPQISCPVMIAAGLYDGIALPQNQRNMASRIPGADLRFFDGGHVFFTQDPTAWPAIIDFLNG
jgi:3-oxoadipate enol-lactonase